MSYYGPHDAVSGTCGENLTWTLDAEGTLTISGAGDMENWERIDYGDGYYDCSSVFCNDDRIRHVVIEEGVTSIGDYAFLDCYGLRDVAIPAGVTRVGKDAFGLCFLLTSVTLPEGVTDIGEGAFSSCYMLQCVRIPGSTVTIGPWAFAISGLLSVEIPGHVTSIGDRAFWECWNLKSIDVAPENRMYSSREGVLYDKSGQTLLVCPERKGSEELRPMPRRYERNMRRLMESRRKLETSDEDAAIPPEDDILEEAEDFYNISDLLEEETNLFSE